MNDNERRIYNFFATKHRDNQYRGVYIAPPGGRKDFDVCNVLAQAGYLEKRNKYGASWYRLKVEREDV